uniref:Uncharacterized protein n=1 Tax=Oryzias sinensis TaxID=183150 RepID=A0A8C7WP18_9TELE
MNYHDKSAKTFLTPLLLRLPVLSSQWGTDPNGSLRGSGRVNTPCVAPYTSTKFALNGFFGSLRHELVMKRSNVSISICTLGLIDTASAMKHVREFTDMPAYPAAEAALNIIITGATRQRELFYPW